MSEPLELEGAEATEMLGARLYAAFPKVTAEPLCIFLYGDLGAGKTTLARGLLRAAGHTGRVPSPTYTLVEPYECAGRAIYHLDLYRLKDAGELEFLGVEEMLVAGSVLLIEWPQHGAEGLLNKDLVIDLKVSDGGRVCEIEALSSAGTALLERLDTGKY